MAKDIQELLASLLGNVFDPFNQQEVHVTATEIDTETQQATVIGAIDLEGNEVSPENLPQEIRDMLTAMGIEVPAAKEVPTIRVRFSILTSNGVGVEEEQEVDFNLLFQTDFPTAILEAGSIAAARATFKASRMLS